MPGKGFTLPAMSAKKKPFATLFASLLVAAALLMPGPNMPRIEVIGIDKLAHVLLFGLWSLALRFDWPLFRRRPALLIAAGAAAALVSESLQLLSPGRAFELVDIAADLLGTALTAALGSRALRVADRLSDRLALRRAARRATRR